MVMKTILTTQVLPCAACGGRRGTGSKRGHLALRSGDCVPQHPLLRSYKRAGEGQGGERGPLALVRGLGAQAPPLGRYNRADTVPGGARAAYPRPPVALEALG